MIPMGGRNNTNLGETETSVSLELTGGLAYLIGDYQVKLRDAALKKQGGWWLRNNT